MRDWLQCFGNIAGDFTVSVLRQAYALWPCRIHHACASLCVIHDRSLVRNIRVRQKHNWKAGDRFRQEIPGVNQGTIGALQMVQSDRNQRDMLLDRSTLEQFLQQSRQKQRDAQSEQGRPKRQRADDRPIHSDRSSGCDRNKQYRAANHCRRKQHT